MCLKVNLYDIRIQHQNDYWLPLNCGKKKPTLEQLKIKAVKD